MADYIHLFSVHSWDRGVIKLCRKCSICPAQTSLSLFAPLLATFFSLLAAKGHIFKKINFILDPLGADVSANLCQHRFKVMAKRKFLCFICVLYCPVFLIMEPGKTCNQGLFFCLVHLPTTNMNTGPSVLAKLHSDDLWTDLCPEILQHQGPTSLPAGQALLAPWETVFVADALHPGLYCQQRSSSLC